YRSFQRNLFCDEKDCMENPEQQQCAHTHTPVRSPDFSRRLHSSPQTPFKYSTPRLKSSTGTPGLSSNTLICSAFTIGFNAAKSIIPAPGGQWSRAGNWTS